MKGEIRELLEQASRKARDIVVKRHNLFASCPYGSLPNKPDVLRDYEAELRTQGTAMGLSATFFDALDKVRAEDCQ